MARQQLIHIHSSVYTDNAPKAPSASYLEYGELAVNYNATEPSLFLRDSNDEIRQIHTSDVILSKAKLGQDYAIHDEVEDDALLEITSDDTVVSSIGKLMRIILDDEEVMASSLNDLNQRIEDINSIIPNFEEMDEKFISLQSEINKTNENVSALEEKVDVIATEYKVKEDYTPVVFEDLSDTDYTMTAVAANDTITDAVTKIDTNISNIIDITLKNENTTSQALNILNQRLVLVEDSIDNVTIDENYTPVEFRELHNTEVVFEPVVASETLTQAVKKIDTNISQLLDAVVENELITSEALNVLNKEINDLKTSTPDELPQIIENVETLNGQMTTLSGSVKTINTNVNTLSGSVQTINTKVNTLSGNVQTVSTNVNTLSRNIQTVNASVNTLSGTVGDLSLDFIALSRKVDNIDVKVASDYTAVTYTDYPQDEYVFTAVVANDTLTQAVHKIDTNISQLIDATIDNEFVFAEALNVVNKKVIDIENSIVPAVVDADYTPVTYPTIPDSQYTFNAVQPNNTLTQAVRKIDTNVSNLVEVIIDNEMIVAEAYNTVNSNLNAQINYFEGVTNVTSTTSIDIAKRLVICKMSVNGSFSLKETPIAGREIHVMVNNTGSSDIIISLPTAEPYVNLSEDSITIEAGKWSEINVLSDGTNMFIRAL